MAKTYKSAFSGAQMEDTFDRVQNKKIAAADVGAVPITRKINNKALSTDISLTAADVGTKRIYNNLSDISSGLTNDSTPFEVANAMEDGSMLVTATSGTQSNLLPRAENGTLIIIKYNIARVSYEFIGEATGFYDAYLRSTADRFTGWRRHYTTANLTVATTAPTSALANDAQVQVYDA